MGQKRAEFWLKVETSPAQAATSPSGFVPDSLPFPKQTAQRAEQGGHGDGGGAISSGINGRARVGRGILPPRHPPCPRPLVPHPLPCRLLRPQRRPGPRRPTRRRLQRRIPRLILPFNLHLRRLRCLPGSYPWQKLIFFGGGGRTAREAQAEFFLVWFAGGDRRRSGRSCLHRAGTQRPRLRRQVLPRSAATAALQVTDRMFDLRCFASP